MATGSIKISELPALTPVPFNTEFVGVDCNTNITHRVELTEIRDTLKTTFVQNAQTASMLQPYVLTASTASMLQPYVLTASTASMLRPYVLTASTASMSVLSASYSSTASKILGGTQYHLPVWTSTNTLGTSSLYESTQILKSIYSGSEIGLKLDFSSGQYIFGDNIDTDYKSHLTINAGQASGNSQLLLISYDSTNNPPEITLDINGTNQYIKTSNGSDIGLKLDFANDVFSLGDFTNANNGTKIIINDSVQTVSITGSLQLSDSISIYHGLITSQVKTAYGVGAIDLSAGEYVIEVPGVYVIAGASGSNLRIPPANIWMGQSITIINKDGSNSITLGGSTVANKGTGNNLTTIGTTKMYTLYSDGDIWYAGEYN
jgi:hypothetical protein